MVTFGFRLRQLALFRIYIQYSIRALIWMVTPSGFVWKFWVLYQDSVPLAEEGQRTAQQISPRLGQHECRGAIYSNSVDIMQHWSRLFLCLSFMHLHRHLTKHRLVQFCQWLAYDLRVGPLEQTLPGAKSRIRRCLFIEGFHGSPVGRQKQSIFSPLGNKISFNAKLFYCFCLPTWLL